MYLSLNGGVRDEQFFDFDIDYKRGLWKRDIALALAHAGGQKVVYENATDEEKKGYNLMSNSSLDAAKLEKLGWRACFDLEEGAEATVKYMKKLRG